VGLRPEPWTWHLLGLLLPALVVTGNLAGGGWVWMGLVWVLLLGPLLDVLCGRTERVRPPPSSGRPYRALLYVHAAAQLVAIGTLLHRAWFDGAAWTTLGSALSTGVGSGVSGIIVAHELGHTRPRSLPWWVGRLNLLTVLYLHFTTEHNHTHHRHVATTVDPASARYGESLWAFLVRTVPGQFVDALRIAFAVFLLEYINYIRHYGLERAGGERLSERHSWQSEERWSRWTLLTLTRHPAHHLKASEPFWRLRPYVDAPELPSGYYGCFWLALVPPLWRRAVHPRTPEARPSG
jgi:alkane 1-monooxygenase